MAKKNKKANLTVVRGARTELKPYKGKTFMIEADLTNSVRYGGSKRLLKEVVIPDLGFYIGHVWVEEYKVPLGKVPHGTKRFLVRVNRYTNKLTGEEKFGLVLVFKGKNRPKKPTLIIPKWRKED